MRREVGTTNPSLRTAATGTPQNKTHPVSGKKPEEIKKQLIATAQIYRDENKNYHLSMNGNPLPAQNYDDAVKLLINYLSSFKE